VTNGQYRLLGLENPVWAVARGKLIDSKTLPVVGDWVLAQNPGGTAVIEQVLPRRSMFMRKGAGKTSKSQVIATNLDRVFVVTSVGADFNPRRIERYLIAVWDGGAEPVIVINKIDMPHAIDEIQSELDAIAFGVPSIFVSAQNGQGLDDLFALCPKGLTVALVGSSGVGKSSLINRLCGSEALETAEVRSKDEKGRHTTTRQELIVTKQGAILIDTPGIRELGLVEPGVGIDKAFADILEQAQHCRFHDCSHTAEPGCAVMEAVMRDEISQERLDSYRRLQREREYNARRSNKRAGANVKKRWKNITLAIKDIKSKKR
jgi:ribosome biogenesis GTPase